MWSGFHFNQAINCQMLIQIPFCATVIIHGWPSTSEHWFITRHGFNYIISLIGICRLYYINWLCSYIYLIDKIYSYILSGFSITKSICEVCTEIPFTFRSHDLPGTIIRKKSYFYPQCNAHLFSHKTTFFRAQYSIKNNLPFLRFSHVHWSLWKNGCLWISSTLPRPNLSVLQNKQESIKGHRILLVKFNFTWYSSYYFLLTEADCFGLTTRHLSNLLIFLHVLKSITYIKRYKNRLLQTESW
jgi:hypothetical protein